MSADVGQLILRLVLGVCMLLHGIAKVIGGVGGITGMLTAAGLPAFLAYGAYAGEVIGPILLIIGWYSRIGAALIALNMLFAIALAHSAEVFTLNDMGGWALELQGMLLFTAIALVLIGPGRFSINRR
jgi:putative oxidoreductase